MSDDGSKGQTSEPEDEATVEESTTDADRMTSLVDDEPEPVEVLHQPPRTSQVIAIVGALVGALLTAPFATLSIPFGIAGFSVFATGLFHTHSRAWLTIGTALVLTGAIITGAYGAIPPELMLLGIGATVIAWDIGQYGIVIGERLGRETRTKRAQLVHTASSAIVIGIVSSVAYAGYQFAGMGQHAAAVSVVILGIVLMAWALRT